MATILPVKGKYPKIGSNCFVAPNATIVGDVIAGNECSFWFNTVVRGDVNSIRMGDKVNVQDNVVIHCTYQKTSTTIGNNVSIGHNAIIHGCTIHNNVLVGMGAIIMDNAIIQSDCIVGAGALITEGMVCNAGGVYAGRPAKRIKDISADLLNGEINRIANNYIKYASWFDDANEAEKVSGQ